MNTEESASRLRQASLIMVGGAGALTGLLGGVGWRLFADGERDLAAGMWGMAIIAVAAILLLAALTRTVVDILDRGPNANMRALRQLESRLERNERELDQLRQAFTRAAVVPGAGARTAGSADAVGEDEHVDAGTGEEFHSHVSTPTG